MEPDKFALLILVNKNREATRSQYGTSNHNEFYLLLLTISQCPGVWEDIIIADPHVCTRLVGDPQILIGCPHYSLKTLIFSLETPKFSLESPMKIGGSPMKL